jgi:hypothetical protein
VRGIISGSPPSKAGSATFSSALESHFRAGGLSIGRRRCRCEQSKAAWAHLATPRVELDQMEPCGPSDRIVLWLGRRRTPRRPPPHDARPRTPHAAPRRRPHMAGNNYARPDHSLPLGWGCSEGCCTVTRARATCGRAKRATYVAVKSPTRGGALVRT